MKKWERIIVYSFLVIAVIYGIRTHQKLQTLDKICGELLFPPPSPVQMEGFILQYLCETNASLRIYWTNDCSNVDTKEYLEATIKILKNQETIGYSELILKTINLAIKEAESELKYVNFKEKNKEDYQNWLNDSNAFKNPDFQNYFSKLNEEMNNAFYDFREALWGLMDKI